MSWDQWTPEEREAFLALADVLLPGSQRLPCASDAGIADCMREALELRSDLEGSVREKLPRVVAGESADQVVRGLDSAGELEALLSLSTGAYCMSPIVWSVLGYSGQEAREAHDDLDSYIELLSPVVDRGHTYRRTPPVNSSTTPHSAVARSHEERL